MQKKFVLIFYCTFHEILLLLIVNGGAINFDALHQLLYLYITVIAPCYNIKEVRQDN